MLTVCEVKSYYVVLQTFNYYNMWLASHTFVQECEAKSIYVGSPTIFVPHAKKTKVKYF